MRRRRKAFSERYSLAVLFEIEVVKIAGYNRDVYPVFIDSEEEALTTHEQIGESIPNEIANASLSSSAPSL